MKPFRPTPRRLEKARKEGNILRSQGFTRFVGLLGLAMGVNLFQNVIWIGSVAEVQLAEAPWEVMSLWVRLGILATFAILTPMVITSVSAEMMVGGFQWQFAKKNHQPFGTLVSGLKGLPSSLIRVAPFVGILGFFPWLFIKAPVLGIAGCVWFFNWVVGAMVVVSMVVGIGDFLWARYRFLSQLSMSHHDMKEEAKDADGDPQLKHARANAHRQLLYEDIVARVRRSRVVVVG